MPAAGPAIWPEPGAPPREPDNGTLRDRVVAEGRLAAYPGARVVVGTEVMGLIVQLPVTEKSPVRKGDLIAELMSDHLRAERAEVEARVAEAAADIRLFERELGRATRLQSARAGTQTEIDTFERNLAAARARKAGAEASRDRLDSLIAKTRILAPIDGVVIARHAQPGEVAGVATPLVTVADLSRVRVDAEVDEYDVGRVALGAAVRVTAEGFPGASWPGRVEEIPDTVVGRPVRPEDPGRPTDLRVLIVKIALTSPTPLKLGQRVEIEITPSPTPAR
jgi:RND family efflux transporter MFP subunit